MYALRTGLCCVSHANNRFGWLQFTIPAFHMPMLLSKFDGRGSNCVKFLNKQDLLVLQVEASMVGGWCSVRIKGSLGACIILVLMQWIHVDMDFSD